MDATAQVTQDGALCVRTYVCTYVYLYLFVHLSFMSWIGHVSLVQKRVQHVDENNLYINVMINYCIQPMLWLLLVIV